MLPLPVQTTSRERGCTMGDTTAIANASMNHAKARRGSIRQLRKVCMGAHYGGPSPVERGNCLASCCEFPAKLPCHPSPSSGGERLDQDQPDRICIRHCARRLLSVRYRRHNRGLCTPDRKSTRLNSSHSQISYAVFCLTKKN